MLPTAMQVQLTEYYAQQGIHPEDFRCAHQDFCRRYAYQGVMTPVKMSMVGSQYGVQYPQPQTPNGHTPKPKQRPEQNREQRLNRRGTPPENRRSRGGRLGSPCSGTHSARSHRRR